MDLESSLEEVFDKHELEVNFNGSNLERKSGDKMLKAINSTFN